MIKKWRAIKIPYALARAAAASATKLKRVHSVHNVFDFTTTIMNQFLLIDAIVYEVFVAIWKNSLCIVKNQILLFRKNHFSFKTKIIRKACVWFPAFKKQLPPIKSRQTNVPLIKAYYYYIKWHLIMTMMMLIGNQNNSFFNKNDNSFLCRNVVVMNDVILKGSIEYIWQFTHCWFTCCYYYWIKNGSNIHSFIWFNSSSD